MDRNVKDILRQAPANVITFNLLAWFGPNKYATLLTKSDESYAQLSFEVKLCFMRMEKYGLGRCLGSGRQLRFQKYHVDYLNEYAVNLIQKTWRLPLFIFGLPKRSTASGDASHHSAPASCEASDSAAKPQPHSHDVEGLAQRRSAMAPSDGNASAIEAKPQSRSDFAAAKPRQRSASMSHDDTGLPGVVAKNYTEDPLSGKPSAAPVRSADANPDGDDPTSNAKRTVMHPKPHHTITLDAAVREGAIPEVAAMTSEFKAQLQVFMGSIVH